jgi:hypothetical protein
MSAMPEFYNRSLIDEVAALEMPIPEEIVINHGAALVIRGIRPEHENGDIDMATNLENNQFLEHELGFRAVRMVVGISSAGKERTITARRDVDDRFDVHRWDFSMFRYNRTGKGRLYLPELGSMSDQDPETGIWVARPELVLLTKLETGRPQDEDDIRRIGQYQSDGY